MQSSSQIITTNKVTQIFYRPDTLPVTKPTTVRALKELKVYRLIIILMYLYQ